MNIEREPPMTRTANRPAVGTVLTIAAAPTRYNAMNDTAPAGYHVGPDGKLWTNEETVTVLHVRKVRGGFKVATSAAFSLTLRAGWEAKYLAV
jgi:hypothetical protein